MKARGFTLYHLIASAFLFSVALSVGFPLLYSYMQLIRLHSASNTMVSALVSARIDAVKHYRPVVLCSSVGGIACDGSGNWERGFLSYIDEDLNGRMGGNEKVLKVYSAMDRGTTIRSEYPDSHQVVYLPSGRVQSTDQFNICISPDATKGRTIEISLVGQPDPRSGAIQCPGSDPARQASFVAQR